MSNGIRMSAEVDLILTAIIAVQHEAGNVGKSGRNEYDGYNYAALIDYKRAYAPLLEKHGLGIIEGVPQTVAVEGGRTTSKGKSENAVFVSLETMIIHTSGQWVIVPMQGEGQDRADKSTYKGITGGRKYARACLLDLVTTDDPEADETVGVGNGAQDKPPKASAQDDGLIDDLI